MRKGLVILIFLGVLLVGSLGIGSSLSCSKTGYLNNHYSHFSSSDECNWYCPGGSCPRDSTQCESVSRSAGCQRSSSGWSYKEYTGSTCTLCSWTCDTEYQNVHCGDDGLGYREKRDPTSCSSSTCNGCNYPSSWETVRFSSYDSNCCTTYSFPSFSTVDLSECNSSGIQNKTVVCPSGSNRCSGSCTAGTTSSIYQDCTYFEAPFFANLSEPNVPINSTHFGDTILLRFGGENIGDRNVTFKLDIKNGTSWWNIIPGLPRRWESFLVHSGNAFEPYKIVNSEKHRINGTIQGENIWKVSDELEINETNNAKPIANITFPEKSTNELNFQTFAVDQDIEFTQASYDEDDLLKLTWDFGDGNNRTFYNYSKALNSSGGNTIYRYNGSNTEVGGKFYTVTLTAEEMTRTQVSEPDSVQIYVFKKGVNVVPIITSPRLREGGYFLHFNASQSYVVNCSEGAMEPAGGIKVNNFNCTYLLAPGRTDLEPDVLGEVRIRWSEVNNFVNRSVIEGGWFTKNEQAGVVWNSTNYNSSVTFSILDPRPTLRKIVMEMNYNATAA
jgi:hypothetical protein